jgi:folate-binding protein YgfZ
MERPMIELPDAAYILPEDRGVLAVDGPDSRDFLQGLVSNDVQRVAADRAIYAALLTAQGRYLHDFFIAAQGDQLLLDVEAARRDDLKRRLSMYRLRAKVTLSDATDGCAVALIYGTAALERLGLSAEPEHARPFGDGVVYVDPRLAALGARALLPRASAAESLSATGLAPGDAADYDRLRLSLGVPDGSRDLPIEKAILLENGFDELHGIDWNKGCYIGQELTARTKYRGLVRKRLMPVDIVGPTPEPGTPLMLDGKEAGEMRGAADGRGLAMIRLEYLDKMGAGGALTAGDSLVTPHKPGWAGF